MLKEYSKRVAGDDQFRFCFKIASCNFEVVGCGESVISPCYGYGVVSVPCLSKCYALGTIKLTWICKNCITNLCKKQKKSRV